MFKLKILFHPNQHRTHVVDLNSFFRLGGYKSISSDASANLEVEVLYDIINLILLTAAEAKTRGCSLIGKWRKQNDDSEPPGFEQHVLGRALYYSPCFRGDPGLWWNRCDTPICEAWLVVFKLNPR